jgi:hypothetical protein
MIFRTLTAFDVFERMRLDVVFTDCTFQMLIIKLKHQNKDWAK